MSTVEGRRDEFSYRRLAVSGAANMTQFNELLQEVGIDPSATRLLRHHTRGGKSGSLFDLWRKDRDAFELYQSTQRAAQPLFRTGRYWASFAVDERQQTIFLGLYEARYLDTRVAEWTCPYHGGEVGRGLPVDIFETALRPELSEQIGELRLDWDWTSVRCWKRYAATASFAVVGETVAPRSGPSEAHDLVRPRSGIDARSGAIVRNYRRSRRAKEVGDQAELAVLEFLRHRGGCAEIVHRAAQGETPGWDIDYRDPSGMLHRIEVKGTEASHFGSIELTANEYRAAHEHGTHYWIFLVADCGTKTPRIQRVQDPARLLTEGAWVARPALYSVGLC